MSKRRADYRTPIRSMLQRLAQSDCGSSSCQYAGRGKGGMRTNGGCMCFDNCTEKIIEFIDQTEGVRP